MSGACCWFAIHSACSASLSLAQARQSLTLGLGRAFHVLVAEPSWPGRDTTALSTALQIELARTQIGSRNEPDRGRVISMDTGLLSPAQSGGQGTRPSGPLPRREDARLPSVSCTNSGERERARRQSSKHQVFQGDVNWNNRKPAVFAAAGKAGIKFAKVGYWRYALKDVRAEVAAMGSDLAGLTQLAKTNGVTIGIHNHQGNLGSALWDIAP